MKGDKSTSASLNRDRRVTLAVLLMVSVPVVMYFFLPFVLIVPAGRLYNAAILPERAWRSFQRSFGPVNQLMRVHPNYRWFLDQEQHVLMRIGLMKVGDNTALNDVWEGFYLKGYYDPKGGGP